MRGNAERARLARRRAAILARRVQRRGIGALGAVSCALFAALMAALGAATGLDSAAVTGTGGAMLLYEDAGGYVLVGVASFTAAVVITALCMKYRNREKKRDTEEEEK